MSEVQVPILRGRKCTTGILAISYMEEKICLTTKDQYDKWWVSAIKTKQAASMVFTVSLRSHSYNEVERGYYLAELLHRHGVQLSVIYLSLEAIFR